MLDSDKPSKPSPKFEVSFIIKDKNGKPTSKRKTFASDDAQGMAKFFNKYQGGGKRKGKKGRGGKGSAKGKSS